MTHQLAPGVQLVEIVASNWREVAAVSPHPEQTEYVAPVTYYLCLSHFDKEWHCLGVEHDGKIVGHVMWGLENDEGWIGGVVVDAVHQQRGIGSAAVVALCDRLAAMPEVAQLALTYEPDNVVARNLYARLGFVETGEMDGDELVARMTLP